MPESARRLPLGRLSASLWRKPSCTVSRRRVLACPAGRRSPTILAWSAVALDLLEYVLASMPRHRLIDLISASIDVGWLLFQHSARPASEIVCGAASPPEVNSDTGKSKELCFFKTKVLGTPRRAIAGAGPDRQAFRSRHRDANRAVRAVERLVQRRVRDRVRFRICRAISSATASIWSMPAG